MSDEQEPAAQEIGLSVQGQDSDTVADAKAILVIFTAALAFCVFYISGWSFDI
ncbi:MAG: hypothetical protein GWP70_00965 [Proteobacteria bacterium]|nr:hypothetical protein [Pseudomonadota bacterium]